MEHVTTPSCPGINPLRAVLGTTRAVQPSQDVTAPPCPVVTSKTAVNFSRLGAGPLAIQLLTIRLLIALLSSWLWFRLLSAHLALMAVMLTLSHPTLPPQVTTHLETHALLPTMTIAMVAIATLAGLRTKTGLHLMPIAAASET